jgi:pyruvate-ferredoxin/flavodoxin oxidoreductase
VEFLELEAEDREGLYPFIWTVDGKQRLSRLLVDSAMVASCEERRDFWLMLKAIARAEPAPSESTPDLDSVRREVIGDIAAGLLQLAEGKTEAVEPAAADSAAKLEATAPSAAAAAKSPAATQGSAEYMAPWLDTEECTACDECTTLNDRIFTYNSAKKAYISNADGGPYRDLVKAAEKCTARVIHPGLPRDRSDKDILKWIKRGEKYN